ncbi:MAG: hypothetical protein K2M11_05670 [Paramuribaculum sp.]|nr:hypothetical protein [Paramuribaculum sp.]
MKNFTFSLKWHKILQSYSTEIRREVLDAVIEYAATGNIIDMQPLSRMAFDFIRYEIDEKARAREARAAKKAAAQRPEDSHAVELAEPADSSRTERNAPVARQEKQRFPEIDTAPIKIKGSKLKLVKTKRPVLMR